jgi:membrane protein implicated in regulation of membrane protease activity
MHISTLARVLGWLMLGLGLVLCLFGALALPDGGLMFALPYAFLLPGISFAGIAGLVLFLTRPTPRGRTRRQP